MRLRDSLIVATFALGWALTSACSSAPTSPTPTGVTGSTVGAAASPGIATATGSSSGSTVESIKVSKCYTNATATSGGQMLIQAGSSDKAARLTAYRPDGSMIGDVQNGGGGRYGGTVMPWQPYDPGTVTVRSSSGGSTTVPTTPFQQ
ncbi:MAG: hypothetical protein U0Q12_14875 [Vicinamibacterales bacterium]